MNKSLSSPGRSSSLRNEIIRVHEKEETSQGEREEVKEKGKEKERKTICERPLLRRGLVPVRLASPTRKKE